MCASVVSLASSPMGGSSSRSDPPRQRATGGQVEIPIIAAIAARRMSASGSLARMSGSRGTRGETRHKRTMPKLRRMAPMKILIALDASNHSERPLECVIGIPRRSRTRLRPRARLSQGADVTCHSIVPPDKLSGLAVRSDRGSHDLDVA